MTDPIHSPSHYIHGGIETKDYVAALLDDSGLRGDVSWWWGNALKYITRWPFKGDTPDLKVQDLRKAGECIEQTARAYEAAQEPETEPAPSVTINRAVFEAAQYLPADQRAEYIEALVTYGITGERPDETKPWAALFVASLWHLRHPEGGGSEWE